MATTFRSDLVAALVAILTAFKAANPTMVKSIYRRKPEGVRETPMAYIGGRAETIVHDSGTRSRTFTVEVVVVDTLADSIETADRLDDLVDALLDYFTANPQQVANTLIEPVGVADVEVEQGTVPYAGVAITLRGRILEGRL